MEIKSASKVAGIFVSSLLGVLDQKFGIFERLVGIKDAPIFVVSNRDDQVRRDAVSFLLDHRSPGTDDAVAEIVSGDCRDFFVPQLRIEGNKVSVIAFIVKFSVLDDGKDVKICNPENLIVYFIDMLSDYGFIKQDITDKEKYYLVDEIIDKITFDHPQFRKIDSSRR